MQRLDNLKLQVRVINFNVGELTEEAQKMSDTTIQMNHTMSMMSHNLFTFFNSQNFIPPPYPLLHDESEDLNEEEEYLFEEKGDE